MRVREKVGIFGYQSGSSQGILIHVFSMNPVLVDPLEECSKLESWTPVFLSHMHSSVSFKYTFIWYYPTTKQLFVGGSTRK